MSATSDQARHRERIRARHHAPHRRTAAQPPLLPHTAADPLPGRRALAPRLTARHPGRKAAGRRVLHDQRGKSAAPARADRRPDLLRPESAASRGPGTGRGGELRAGGGHVPVPQRAEPDPGRDRPRGPGRCTLPRTRRAPAGPRVHLVRPGRPTAHRVGHDDAGRPIPPPGRPRGGTRRHRRRHPHGAESACRAVALSEGRACAGDRRSSARGRPGERAVADHRPARGRGRGAAAPGHEAGDLLPGTGPCRMHRRGPAHGADHRAGRSDLARQSVRRHAPDAAAPGAVTRPRARRPALPGTGQDPAAQRPFRRGGGCARPARTVPQRTHIDRPVHLRQVARDVLSRVRAAFPRRP